MSQAVEQVAGDGPGRLSGWTRVVVAAPGIIAAALVIAAGVYLVATGASFAASLPADDDFASIRVTAIFVGVAACAFGLMLAAATLIVALARPHRVLLALAALFAGVCAVGAVYMLATGADGIVYMPLAAVLAYLFAVAVLRLLPRREGSNA